MKCRNWFSPQVIRSAVQNTFKPIEKLDRFDSDNLEFKSFDQYEPLYYDQSENLIQEYFPTQIPRQIEHP